MCVCLPLSPSNGCTEGFFVSCTSYQPDSIYTSCFDTNLKVFSWRHHYTTSTFLQFIKQQVLPVRLVLSKWHALICKWLAEHFIHQYFLHWPVKFKICLANLGDIVLYLINAGIISKTITSNHAPFQWLGCWVV